MLEAKFLAQHAVPRKEPAVISIHGKPKSKIVGSREETTYELTLPVAVKGLKFSSSSGEDSMVAGSDSLDAPKSSSSGFLFLLRLSGEAAGGGELG
jgi:hypothetical protein